jgi:hypothetical protein
MERSAKNWQRGLKPKVYYTVIKSRNPLSMVPWKPKGKVMKMSLEELLQQLPVKINPSKIQFGLGEVGAEPRIHMEVLRGPGDEERLNAIQKRFNKEIHNTVSYSSSSSPTAFVVEIEPADIETLDEDMDDESDAYW